MLKRENGSWAARPHTATLSLLHHWHVRERIRRVKARKFVGWDKDSLIWKAKPMHPGWAKQGIHSVLPIGRQVFSHLQQSRVPSHMTVTWENKCHHSKHPPLPPPSPYFIDWAWCQMVWNVPFDQLGSPLLAVSPPILPCTPSFLSSMAVGKAEKVSDLCEPSWAITKPSVQHKSKT